MNPVLRDRRAALVASTALNGLDYVALGATPGSLAVHFVNAVALADGTGVLTISGGVAGRTLLQRTLSPALDWSTSAGQLVLSLRLAFPADAGAYTLAITSSRLDPFYASVRFSFAAETATPVDCQPVSAAATPTAAALTVINYLAKDFLSFRQALFDYSALYYPQWQERAEADFGVMFAEALSALGDELSYTQDRVAREATLPTATQRRSVLRHARLVGYQAQQAQSATVLLQFDVDGFATDGVTSLTDAIAVFAAAPDGSQILFETGTGLRSRSFDAEGTPLPGGETFPVSPLWNSGHISAYWLDDSARTLAAGATSVYVAGHGYGFSAGQALLIETQDGLAGTAPVRQIVHLVSAGATAPAVETWDALFPTSPALPQGAPITQLNWDARDALTVARDLAATTVVGNLVPATQGQTWTARFRVATAADVPEAGAFTIVRTGPRATLPDGTAGATVPQHLYTLQNSPVGWLAAGDRTDAALAPEVVLVETGGEGAARVWTWYDWLLDADAGEPAYTLDAARYTPLPEANSDGSVQYEYDSDAGDTLRFGDHAFGRVPDAGSQFTVSYRTGAGSLGNVAADTITGLIPYDQASNGILRVRNPLPASGGQDAESLDAVRLHAPQQVLAAQARAVVPQDYQALTEALPWVARANAVSRWTGSWLSVMVTPDPAGSVAPSLAQEVALARQLAATRMTGTDTVIAEAQYLTLDLAITVNAQADTLRSVLTADLIQALAPAPEGGTAGFFSPGNFTFGQPLWRSALEAVIQDVQGVAGVLAITVRPAGSAGSYRALGARLGGGTRQIVRCDNDPAHRERGSFTLILVGGK